MQQLSSRRLRLAALTLALTAVTGLAMAQVFNQPDTGFKGAVRVASQGSVLPGNEIELEGSGFRPGQRVTLFRGATALNAQPYTVDAEGGFKAKIAIPADAAAARHPIIVRADGPDAALVFDLKVSKEVPLSGADRFDILARPITRGLYQSAYSAKDNVLFVTSAVGRPPVTQSELLKVDADSLDILARVTPAKVPGHDDNRVYAVYGVGVDDARGNVWVTNTRDDSVAVYRASDLQLVKQFEQGALPHGRDVVVDSQRGRVYASPVGEPRIVVFDAATLEQLPDIEIPTRGRGEAFSPTSLALDEATGRLFTVSLSTSEAAIIDGPGGKLEKKIPLSNAASAIGVGWDSDLGRLLVVSQGSDNLLIVDPDSGETLHDVYVGNGALNVVYDPLVKLTFVSNRGAGTVTVVDADGRIVANLDGGSAPNHLRDDGRGHVFLATKARGAEDPRGDQLIRYTLKTD
ncbi:ATP-binding protein [Luteimonas sp. BDR2-5]|uniref:YncE family protein n=1 Tax=Proluteimonas luteida TaxID=2878685 RepID=UPI001E54B9A8|nr:ATP-binding protein [Luteimonas sp. BDR2-5]MCD9028294.1 ATP-binding protein [Luteimonas sp. BDR2-5]